MPLYRHVVSGTFYATEEWSFTLHTDSANDLATANTRMVTAVEAMWTGKLDADVSTGVIVTEVSTASLTVATGQQISRVIADVNLPGASATQSLPAQCATAISLTTPLATRAGRGRFYLPPLRVSAVASGRLAGGTIANIVTSIEAFFASLDGGTPLTPVLYSRTTHLTTNVTGANVGDVIDTQRRRRNKMIEMRTPITI